MFYIIIVFSLICIIFIILFRIIIFDSKEIINENPPKINNLYINNLDTPYINNLDTPYINNFDNKKLSPFNNWEIKKVFTYEELKFYKLLLEYFKGKNIFILPKIRIADLVKPKKHLNNSEFMKTFLKLSQKHIDFVLSDYNGKILCLIELDGNSHNYGKTKENDKFKNEFFKEIGITLVRFYNYSNYNLSKLDQYILQN